MEHPEKYRVAQIFKHRALELQSIKLIIERKVADEWEIRMATTIKSYHDFFKTKYQYMPIITFYDMTTEREISDIFYTFDPEKYVEGYLSDYFTKHKGDIRGDPHSHYEFNIKLYYVDSLPEKYEGKISDDRYWNILGDELECFVENLKNDYKWIVKWFQVDRMGGWLALETNENLVDDLMNAVSDFEGTIKRYKDTSDIFGELTIREQEDILKHAKGVLEIINLIAKRYDELRAIDELIKKEKAQLGKAMGTEEYWKNWIEEED